MKKFGLLLPRWLEIAVTHTIPINHHTPLQSQYSTRGITVSTTASSSLQQASSQRQHKCTNHTPSQTRNTLTSQHCPRTVDSGEVRERNGRSER